MNSSEAASKLGTTPKELRRFLRADPAYTNAANTASGRYNFTDSDFALLKRRFDAWQSKNAGRKRAPKIAADGSPAPKRRTRTVNDEAMPTDILRGRLYTSERHRRDELSRERVDRLEQQLMAAGLHISQLRDPDRVVS